MSDIVERLMAYVHQCRPGFEKPIHADIIRAATLIEARDAEIARLREAAKKALNFIENTEGDYGITLGCGDALRAALKVSP